VHDCNNILLNRIEFLNQVIESSFSIRLECLNSTSQLNSTLFQKNFNSTRLELKYSTQHDQFKKDDNLRFCIDYRKLNALIKRDHYSLSLINETFACIQESKYLTQLNIIVAFNKLHMHSDSKDLTIFIIFFNSYKYHVMLFELINESAFYQYYMNDMLFKYLHQFCQIYLNDIIIYSKILKKHK